MILDENQYRMIVDSSPNMIWRSGTDTSCNYFNRTWLEFTGRTIEQEVGNGWTEGVHPDDFEFCVNYYLTAFEKIIAFEMNYRLKRKDGQWRWINDRGVPYFDDKAFSRDLSAAAWILPNKYWAKNLKQWRRPTV